jgi:hypothetical protein
MFSRYRTAWILLTHDFASLSVYIDLHPSFDAEGASRMDEDVMRPWYKIVSSII